MTGYGRHSLSTKSGSNPSPYSGNSREWGDTGNTSVIFPCVQCQGRLPVKNVNGVIVKKWDDDRCSNCWTATDMVSYPEKYGLTPDLQRFITYLDPDRGDSSIIINSPEHTLYADIMTGLYHFCGFDDPTADRDELVRILTKIKADPLSVLIQLYQLLPKDDTR